MNRVAPTLEPAGDAAVLPSVFPQPGRAPTRGRILLVDDDPLVRTVFSGWLGLHDYEHHHAANPAGAEALLDRRPVELVLSDIHMPGNTRLEWVEQVLRREHPPAILLMTGQPEFETACRAANLPVAGYLVKPVDFSTLDATLQRIIHRQRRRADFLSLSGDIVRLLGSLGLQDSAKETMLVNKLALLAACFNSRRPEADDIGPAPDQLWRTAIADTIAVIEKTKHSFRSKDLGELRRRLQQLLGSP